MSHSVPFNVVITTPNPQESTCDVSKVRRKRVVVADDHTIVRRGLVSLLSLNHGLEIVGEAADGRVAVELVKGTDPDIILMDISMPGLNGLEATRQIKKTNPSVKVLILSGYDNETYIRDSLRSGANGYLLKNSTAEELYSAIDAVCSGQAFFSPLISQIIVDDYLKIASGNSEQLPETADRLTQREREVLQLIAEGKSHQQIAQLLFISVRTVDTHRNNIMQKLDIHDTASLVMYAIRNGIVILPQ